jgi:ABC-type antimicrobial peptide transport system permease subunit
LIIGLGLSVLAAFGLRSVLVGDGRFDAPVVLAAMLALTGAAILAAWLPARRATRVAATTAIRSE